MSSDADGSTGSARAAAPSDFERVREGDRVRLGGRVVYAEAGVARISDAFAVIDVEIGNAARVAPGELVILEGVRQGTRVVGAAIVERIAPTRPPGAEATETNRLVDRGVGRYLLARARAMASVRRFFDTQGFVEIDTPAMVPSPGLDVHLDAFEVKDAPVAPDRARAGLPAAYLITSPEYQMKRLLAGGVPRCYQLAHCFRRGEVGARHNPEFVMIEWYRAFAAMDDIMSDTEQLVRDVVRDVAGRTTVDVGGRSIDVGARFERMSVGEAFEEFAGVRSDEAIALATNDEDRYFRLLVDAVEPALARRERAVFLVDFPAPHASLARLSSRDARVAERFELYVGGVELCNGFGELTDAGEQRRRFERDREARARTGKPVYPIDERFVRALEEGMPPSAGNALGFDRLVALTVGAKSIADVLSFPLEWL